MSNYWRQDTQQVPRPVYAGFSEQELLLQELLLQDLLLQQVSFFLEFGTSQWLSHLHRYRRDFLRCKMFHVLCDHVLCSTFFLENGTFCIARENGTSFYDANVPFSGEKNVPCFMFRFFK